MDTITSTPGLLSIAAIGISSVGAATALNGQKKARKEIKEVREALKTAVNVIDSHEEKNVEFQAAIRKIRAQINILGALEEKIDYINEDVNGIKRNLNMINKLLKLNDEEIEVDEPKASINTKQINGTQKRLKTQPNGLLPIRDGRFKKQPIRVKSNEYNQEKPKPTNRRQQYIEPEEDEIEDDVSNNNDTVYDENSNEADANEDEDLEDESPINEHKMMKYMTQM